MASLHPSVDPYGFERNQDFDHSTYDEFMAHYLRVLARRAKRWEDLLKSKNMHRGYKVKRFIRKGIPKEHRGMIWMALSGAQELKAANPNEYQKLLEGEHDDEVIETIQTDIPRTFPDNIYFRDTPDGKCHALENVLIAIAHHDLSVGYCQGLNFIAGILLLLTDCEETTYWLLLTLLEKILPDYYTKHMLGLLTDIEVLSELISLKSPPIATHLKQHNVPLSLLVSKWFVCLFADVLPIETVLRIWDSLFYEGSKILFRVSLTLIMKNQDKILKAEDFPEIVEAFKEMMTDAMAVECHLFMESIFQVPGSLSMKDIEQLRSKCRKVVEEQQNKYKK